MKRVFSIILVLALAASAVMLASCGDNTAESGTEETKTEEITVPDVTLHYVAAVIYADQVTAEANELKAADNSNLSGWFNETLEFDENLLVKIPEAFSYVDSYVLRISQGQYIEEVDVFKAKDQADTGSIKPMVDYRCNKQKNNNDFKLYDDENGTNAKMMDTGKSLS